MVKTLYYVGQDERRRTNDSICEMLCQFCAAMIHLANIRESNNPQRQKLIIKPPPIPPLIHMIPHPTRCAPPSK